MVMPRASTTSAPAGTASSSRPPTATIPVALDQHHRARQRRPLVAVDEQPADDGEVGRRRLGIGLAVEGLGGGEGGGGSDQRGGEGEPEAGRGDGSCS